MPKNTENHKSLESWIWDAACSIRGAQDAPKYKDFILPLIFTKRLCDVFDDEVERISEKVGSRRKAFKLVAMDEKLVRFYLPLVPDDPEKSVWSVIRKLSDKIGEQLTAYLREIAKANPVLEGIIDRIDFNATTHGQRDIDDGRLSNLIEKISEKRLGLKNVEPDIIGRSYEYLIRKFAEGSGQSAGEFYTPREVGMVMAKLMDPEPGMTVYDPCCGSAGLLIKCQLVMKEKNSSTRARQVPLKLFGQEYIPSTWAMANMNMFIHDMEGKIEIGDTFRNPKFRARGKLQTFDRVVANPMWSQKDFTETDYAHDELGRFPSGAGYPGNKADWGWMQHILASTAAGGKATVVIGTGAASRGSGEGKRDNKEKEVRQYFIEKDLIEAVLLLPENLFYNTPNAGLVFVLNKEKRHPGEILMIDVSECFDRGRAKNTLNAQAEDHILNAYLNWKAIPGVSAVATLNSVADTENDFNLLPNRYIHRPLPANWERGVYGQFEAAKREFARKLVFDFLARFLRNLKKSIGSQSEMDLPRQLAGWELHRLGELLGTVNDLV
jgi:type I restriction enzyme M protein